MDDVLIRKIDISWKPSTPDSVVTDFKTDFSKAVSNCHYRTVGAASNSTDKISNILNKVFNVIIVMTMFLCFFALSANMSANLF
jgi:hypothetical protein